VPSLRVLHFPDWRAGNPYQQLLADALAARGIDVAFSTYVGAFFPLWRNVRTHGADVLHLHWIAEISGADEKRALRYLAKQLNFRLDVLLVRAALRGRIVWTVHNLTAHENLRPTGDRATRRFLARRARLLLTHCGAAKRAVMDSYGIGGERVKVTPFGHFMDAYPNAAGREESRRRLDLPDDRYVFLYLGSIRRYKGVEDLIGAFRSLAHPAKLLVIAGAAPDLEYLEELRACGAGVDVRFQVGFVPPDEIQYFLNAADAVVLPFRDVLSSASLVLVMGFGRLVVAPRIGCIPETADPAGTVLYDPSRPGALEAALAQAASRDSEECGRHNRARATTFDWQSMASETAGAYRDLVATDREARRP
jgi:glycosyltransferase involved in cell wall biosynthesis